MQNRNAKSPIEVTGKPLYSLGITMFSSIHSPSPSNLYVLLDNNVYSIFFCPASKVCSSNNFPHMVHSVCFKPSSVCVTSKSTIQPLAIQSITGSIACGTTIVPQRLHFLPSVRPVSWQVGDWEGTNSIFSGLSCLQSIVLS